MIEYEWKLRQGDIGTVEGLEKRMKGAPDELVKYIAQMRKWSELELASPNIIGQKDDWKRFKELSARHPAFYCIRHSEEVAPVKGKTLSDSWMEDNFSILILNGNADIVWEQVLEHRRTESRVL